MSDVHCAAELLVARHAQAEYDNPALTDAGGTLTLAGRAQARALAEGLQGRRIALIYSSDLARAVQTAEIAAGVLGVPVRVRPALREFPVGSYAGRSPDPEVFDEMFRVVVEDIDDGISGGEPNRDIVTRVSDELAAIVDEHRGETVLVVGHGGAFGATLPRLARNLPDGFALTHPLGYCDVVELAGDADGWLARSWAGGELAETASASASR